MKSITLSRRTVLRGAGGALVGLPVLEAMLDRNGEAFAQGGPAKKKLIICMCGQSMGTGARADGGPERYYIPSDAGPGYSLAGKVVLAPLEPVKEHVTVVTGLKVPSAVLGTPTPAGGWSGLFHTHSWAPVLTGFSAAQSTTVRGPTADHIAAKVLEADTRRLPLALRVQAATYYGGNGATSQRGTMSYRQNTDGKFGRHDPITSPDGLWNSLFKGLPAPTGTGSASLPPADTMRLSVVDAVRERARLLMSRLGKTDRALLGQHLEEIYQLEQRVKEPPKLTAGCQRPPAPGPDPKLGLPIQTIGGEGPTDLSDGHGWSDEDRRAQLMIDFLRMAFACGSTRVATLMLTFFQSYMNSYSVTGRRSDVHELSHGGGSLLDHARMIAWHMKWYGQLIAAFKATPDAGGTMLDNTVIVMLQAGGYGQSPESGGKTYSAHSTENMATLYAGGSSAKMRNLKFGHHIRATGQHPVGVLISVLDALGVFPGGEKKMGEVSGVIPELFG